MRQIAIYGKGGIGKSIIASNISAALAEKGLKLMQVGCDPKQDSVRPLTKNQIIPSILKSARKNPNFKIDDVLVEGFRGVLCAEAGGPEPGTGCAGRGVVKALEMIRDEEIATKYEIDIVIYDVLGDVVCGGFAMPMRENFAEEIYIVTSDEFTSLYAANNICIGIKRIAESGSKCRLGGIIHNERVESMSNAVDFFAEDLGSRVIGLVPFSQSIREYEIKGTTIEFAPNSDIANIFRKIGDAIWNNQERVIPNPISRERIAKIVEEARIRSVKAIELFEKRKRAVQGITRAFRKTTRKEA